MFSPLSEKGKHNKSTNATDDDDDNRIRFLNISLRGMGFLAHRDWIFF